MILLGLGHSGAIAGDFLSVGCGPDYGLWGCGYYPWVGNYAQDSVPYYALHPPVYYSYPVPRPYGYSPFPYPPGVLTPEVAAPEPKIIQNQYVPRRSSMDAGSSDRVTRQPLRIRNPFVAQADGSDAGKKVGDTSPQATRPQVIYPARLTQTL